MSEKKARVNLYTEDAVLITSHWRDFKGELQDWRNAIYDLFRWDMTYSYAHKIDVIESRKNGVFVSLRIKPEFEESVVETMKDLGFCKIKATHEEIGTIECTELPDDMLIDFAIVDY